jgi:hypothetical protein
MAPYAVDVCVRLSEAFLNQAQAASAQPQSEEDDEAEYREDRPKIRGPSLVCVSQFMCEHVYIYIYM